MSPSKPHESKPNSSASAFGQSASPHSGANGVPVESVDGVEAQAMERLAEDSADFVEQLIDLSAADSQVIPVVEILPPEAAALDPDRLANMAVDRTQISLGLTGISFNRTRLSGASGQPARAGGGKVGTRARRSARRPPHQPPGAATKCHDQSAAPTKAGTAQGGSQVRALCRSAPCSSVRIRQATRNRTLRAYSSFHNL